MTKHEGLELVRTDADGVDVFKVGTLEVRAFNRMTPTVRRFVTEVAHRVAVDSQDAALMILDDILQSETVEQSMARSEVIHGKDLIGKKFTIHDVKWNRSRLAEGLPFYAVLDITAIGGDKHEVVTTSATNVMGQLWLWQDKGWLPIDVRLDQASTPTPDGYYPQRLVPPDSDEAF